MICFGIEITIVMIKVDNILIIPQAIHSLLILRNIGMCCLSDVEVTNIRPFSSNCATFLMSCTSDSGVATPMAHKGKPRVLHHALPLCFEGQSTLPLGVWLSPMGECRVGSIIGGGPVPLYPEHRMQQMEPSNTQNGDKNGGSHGEIFHLNSVPWAVPSGESASNSWAMWHQMSTACCGNGMVNFLQS